MNYHFSESRAVISSSMFLRHVYQCCMKNRNLNKTFFEINFLLTTNSRVKVNHPEKHFQNKG